MSKTWVGQNAVSLGTAPAFEAYTGVRLWYDDENCLFAGDETGRVMEADCPWADQAMAKNVLESIKGFVYQPFEAGTALLDMEAELGDGVTVGGIYGPLAFINTSFGGLCASEIGAPSEEEVDHEYPYKPKQQRQMERSFRQVYSLIEKTDSAIRLMVVDEIEGLESELEQTAKGFNARVESVEGAYTSLSQTVDGISTRVSGVEGNYTSLSQTVNGISASVSGLGNQYSELALTVDGFTVTDQSGITRIKGSSIETETLYVDAAHIEGTLSARQVVLTGSISWTDLDSGVQSEINNAGGYSKSQIKTFINESLVASPNIAGATFYDLPDSGDLSDSLAFLELNAQYNSGIVGPVLRYVDNQNGHEAFKIWTWNRHCYMGLCGGLGWMCSPTETDEDSDGNECQVYHALGTHAFGDKVRFEYKVEFAPGCEVTGLSASSVPVWG